MLHGEGEITFLVFYPESSDSGSFEWSTSESDGQKSAEKYFPNSEGIDVSGDELYFISKEIKTMYILKLDEGTYTRHSTRSGLFSGEPDQIVRLTESEEDLLYFTEDGGKYAGIHARNRRGQYLTILESYKYDDETTGLSFSPDNMHMYIAYQDNGLLFDITRMDGLPFTAKVLNVKYHNTADA
jgi:hypothetical protein